MLKPESFEDRDVYKILNRILEVIPEVQVIGQYQTKMSPEQAEKLYHEHRERDFFKKYTELMTSGPILAVCLEGDDIICKVRNLMGPSDPEKAPKGTIRGDFAESTFRNKIHGSDSEESAKRELGIFFPCGKGLLKEDNKSVVQR